MKLLSIIRIYNFIQGISHKKNRNNFRICSACKNKKKLYIVRSGYTLLSSYSQQKTLFCETTNLVRLAWHKNNILLKLLGHKL